MEKTDKRWYDKNAKLTSLLELLRVTQPSDQERIITGMKELIMEYDPQLMDRWVLEFPLTTKRRWYDKNPYFWLVINSLKYADTSLLGGVLSYLKAELKPDVE